MAQTSNRGTYQNRQVPPPRPVSKLVQQLAQMGDTRMPKRVRIRCINKTDRRSAHERIKNVGGVNSDGTRWKLSVKKTIRDLESREWEYYVEESGVTVEVIVATDGRNKYIKTTVDGIQPDNLLSLPECP